MIHRARIGLRTRLAIALAGIAVVSVAIATVLSNAGLDSRLNCSCSKTQQDHQLTDLHLLAGAAAVAVGLLAATLVAARLSRPLRQLTTVARSMERGDLDARANVHGVPEIAALAQALNRLAETLQQEDQLRRAAAADIAHELRTPLGAVLSRIEAAQDGMLEDEASNLEAIHTEALRLTQLVEDLGKLTEAQQPGLTVQKEPVDLGRLVAERADVHRDQFRAKGVALEQFIKPVSADGEPGRIAQIIDNLLSNALRHTEPEGRVSISTCQQGDEAVVEVVDSGAGISGEDLPHIFERFWRGEHPRAHESGGAGIGLAIVRELVRAHDGRIDVESTPGEGSRFSVALPAPGTNTRLPASPNSASGTDVSSSSVDS
jgi:two-component system, OmpR family, sensor histidine kinase BaeS